jgi:hypothetical protein
VQLLDHGEGECAALVGLLVKKAQGFNVVFVLFDKIAKAV